MRRTTHGAAWSGLSISAVFLLLAIRNVQWADVLSAWRAARLELLVAGLAPLLGAWFVASVRWRLILVSVPSLRVRDTFAYIMIGFLANAVLPFRLGELVRVTLMGRRKHIGVSRVMGSVALERVMDLLSLVLIMLGLSIAMDIPPVVQAGITTVSITGVALILWLTVLAFHRSYLERVLAWLNRYVREEWTRRPAVLLREFCSGVGVIRDPVHLGGVFLLSLVIRFLGGGAVLVWLHAFNLSTPWHAALFVSVVVNLGSAIPSSPGYIGGYHYLSVLSLSLWVPDRAPALAYAIGTHAVNILANVSLGALALAREGISFEEISKGARWQESSRGAISFEK